MFVYVIPVSEKFKSGHRQQGAVSMHMINVTVCYICNDNTEEGWRQRWEKEPISENCVLLITNEKAGQKVKVCV